MPREKQNKRTPTNGNGGRPEGHLGFGATLWATADKLRGNLDTAEYKHVVLGLTFTDELIDQIVYRLYALTPGEIKLVKETSRP